MSELDDGRSDAVDDAVPGPGHDVIGHGVMGHDVDSAVVAGEEDAWQRLTAADPAGPDPDLAALQARILGTAGAHPASDDVPAPGADVIPLRPRRPLAQQMVGLAAGVALLAGVGVGGFALGHRAADDVVAGGAPQALAGAEKAVVAPSAAAFGAGETAEDTAAADASTRVTVPSAAPAPTEAAAPFAVDAPATALPAPAEELAGFSVSDAGIDRPALSAQLARAFGVTGEPVMLPSGDWVTGPGEGSNAILVVGASAAVPWSMTNPAPPLPSGAALSEPQANEVARTIFARLGVPVDEVEWEAVSVGGLVTETAWYVVAGERTPMFWRLAFDQSGEIVSASGFAGTLLPLPE